MSSRDFSEVSSSLSQTSCSVNTAKKYLAKVSKVLSTKSNIRLKLKYTRLFGNNQSFYSIADFFVRFTALSEQKVSLQEEKSNVSSPIDQSKMISVSDLLFMMCRH